MNKCLSITLAIVYSFFLARFSVSQELTYGDRSFTLEICAAGTNSIRITLKPLSFEERFPFSPALNERDYPDPVFSLSGLTKPDTKRIGRMLVTVSGEPLTVRIEGANGKVIQEIIFSEDGTMRFQLDGHPVLGMGEGGPRMGRDWREQEIEFDRRGRLHEMVPRWQSNAYGSRNPVAMIIGTGGWALFVATPWGQIDLTTGDEGIYIPWIPPDIKDDSISSKITGMIQGRPPVDKIIPGVYDVFVFDASDPFLFMKDVSVLTGPAVMPPEWSLGYMQSHRTLEDENQMLDIVDTFREKRIPVDAVIYLGTGFCPRGWNTEQPSFDFNPEVFKRDPADVIADLHNRNVKVITHIIPWSRDRLPTLCGNIPPWKGEVVNNSHILNYWLKHSDLVEAGIDAWWPDEGDWFNLYERMKRHQMYYQGPLYTTPDVRPWSLHRNGYLGIAKWGGWVWSGDTESSWKTLEGQIAVGINHSLSLSPYWGSDIGGFYPDEELTGELYARWFQFGAFCPSFRSHGRTWWTRLPWGWGLGEMGPLENRTNPLQSELNNPVIEQVCRKYDELRYQLMPYTYTLAWEARTTGMPLMRAMWLHHPDDIKARNKGDQYFWGRDLLIAPVYTKGAKIRTLYLPEGKWYDWWTNKEVTGGKSVIREVDLTLMPIYVRAGAIIPFDPVRQYTGEIKGEPTTIIIYRGEDGEFILYEDDGISQEYLKGVYRLTSFSWNDKKKRLTIEPESKINTKGKPGKRTFKVHLIPDNAFKEVIYSGQPVNVNF